MKRLLILLLLVFAGCTEPAATNEVAETQTPTPTADPSSLQSVDEEYKVEVRGTRFGSSITMNGDNCVGLDGTEAELVLLALEASWTPSSDLAEQLELAVTIFGTDYRTNLVGSSPIEMEIDDLPLLEGDQELLIGLMPVGDAAVVDEIVDLHAVLTYRAPGSLSSQYSSCSF